MYEPCVDMLDSGGHADSILVGSLAVVAMECAWTKLGRGRGLGLDRRGTQPHSLSALPHTAGVLVPFALKRGQSRVNGVASREIHEHSFQPTIPTIALPQEWRPQLMTTAGSACSRNWTITHSKTKPMRPQRPRLRRIRRRENPRNWVSTRKSTSRRSAEFPE